MTMRKRKRKRRKRKQLCPLLSLRIGESLDRKSAVLSSAAHAHLVVPVQAK
jgi:hypothetical protein